jgi:DNA-binding transcriptional ArsR family regulator
VFARVAQRPRPVGELARELPVSRPAVSQHLRILKDAGLVVDRRDGNRRIYTVEPNGLAALRSQLEQFWNDALANFKALVDEANQEDE